MTAYQIKLPVFEGPFDLLLFFIERDELDIYNIPITKVTDDFLAYLREMQSKNIDLASEFILVAATLMRIKAKMLIPRKEKDETGNEIDPRAELVNRLLEYKRYKSVIEELQSLENERALRETRGGVSQELQKIATKALVDVELESLTLFKLLQTYEKVLQRYDIASKVVVHTVATYEYTIASQRDFVLKTMQTHKKRDFMQFLTQCENRIHAIFTFLAILELIQLREIVATIGEGTNNFWLMVAE